MRCQPAAAAARLGEHPVADRHDEPGLLGDRDEPPGGEKPVLVGCAPAHERLHADDESPCERRRSAGNTSSKSTARERGAQRRTPSVRRAQRGIVAARRRRTRKRVAPDAPSRGTSRCRRLRAARCCPSPSPADAIPMLAMTCSSCAAIANGSRERRDERARPADVLGRSVATSSSETMNSSPPRRRERVASRSRPVSALRRLRRSSSSPASWPSVSLITLKRSRSMKSAPTHWLSRVARASACPSRSWSSTRFGRSVKGSCKAWRRMLYSAR